jgi:hypothetical protein
VPCVEPTAFRIFFFWFWSSCSEIYNSSIFSMIADEFDTIDSGTTGAPFPRITHRSGSTGSPAGLRALWNDG